MNIFVGNLTYTCTEEELREAFEQYGAVESVRIITDRETRRSRGFGFVEMNDATEAKAAIDAMDGQNFGGRDLKVNEGRPREERKPPRRY